MAGVQQPFDAAGPLKQARDAMREFGQEVDQVVGKLDRLQGERTVKVAMVGDTGGGILPPGQARWSEAPDPNRYRRMILPGDTAAENLAGGATSDLMGQRALEYWQKLGAGGATHALRHAGDFALKGWDSFLPTREKEEHGEMLRLAASRPGQEFASAMEGMEKAGQKIAAFLAEIAKGGDAADKAREPLAAAREELEGMSGKGSRALSAMPGGRTKEALAVEAARLHEDAASGVLREVKGKEGGSGFDLLSGRQLAGFMRNPGGTLMGAAEGGLASLLQGGLSMGGAAGMASLGVAAVGGTLYGGYKLADRMADKATEDAVRARQDVLLGRQGGFDFRGTYWNAARDRALPGVDSLNAREAWGGLNDTVSLAGWNPESRRNLTANIIDRAPQLGMETGQLGSWLGTAIRTGATDPGKIEQYENRIQNLLQGSLEAGVASKETLSAIASLNAKQVDQLGALSPQAAQFHEGALSILNATGDKSLQGAQGARVLGAMGANKSEGQMAMLLRAAGGSGAVDSILQGTLSPEDAKRVSGMSMFDKVNLLNQSETAKQALVIQALQSGAFEGMPASMVSGLTGVNIDPLRMSKIQELITKGDGKGNALTPEQILKNVDSMEKAPAGGISSQENSDLSKFSALMKANAEKNDAITTKANEAFATGVTKFNVAVDKMSNIFSEKFVKAVTGMDANGRQISNSERVKAMTDLYSLVNPALSGSNLQRKIIEKSTTPNPRG